MAGDSLYVFYANTDERTYKFNVYASSLDKATEYRDEILKLYKDHYGRVLKAKRASGLQVADYYREKDTKNLSEIQRLDQTELDYSKPTVLIGAAQDKEYYGRRMSPPWVGIAIFDKSSKLITDFDCKYTGFARYIQKAERKIKQYQNVNSPEQIKLIDRYVSEFFECHPETQAQDDILKMLADEKRLSTQLKDKVNFDLLDCSYSEKYQQVTDFIDKKKKLNSKTANSNSGITPLMYTAARLAESGDIPTEIVKNAEKVCFELLQAGADINAKDANGRTALMYIAMGYHMFYLGQSSPGREKLTRLLLKHGADPTIKDHLGKTAIDYFKQECGNDHPTIPLLKAAESNFQPTVFSRFRSRFTRLVKSIKQFFDDLFSGKGSADSKKSHVALASTGAVTATYLDGKKPGTATVSPSPGLRFFGEHEKGDNKAPSSEPLIGFGLGR